MSRSDTLELFGRYKRFLEKVLKQTEALSGYPAVRAIPHTFAGFLYMAAAVMALRWEAWGLFERLFTARFEWYYQSGRPMFNYGFDVPYFFHSEAFGRKANAIHDFYRKLLSDPEIASITSLSSDRTTDMYVQTQMLMYLKVVQLHEQGANLRIWPDFGRFYGQRVLSLLDRAYVDSDFGCGLLRAFGEDKQIFFSRLNDRLKTIQSFFSGSPYLYESIGFWEPRETHA